MLMSERVPREFRIRTAKQGLTRGGKKKPMMNRKISEPEKLTMVVVVWVYWFLGDGRKTWE